MPANTEELRKLVERVGAFHITDKAMLSAQRAMEQRIDSPTIDAGAQEQYLKTVRNYFEGFEREARVHLHDVDKRLEHANQVVFNLTAERGVAVKRIEATRGILETISGVQVR